MSHSVTISSDLSKEEKYKFLLPQIVSLVEDETDIIVNLSNICAALKYNMDDFFWVGFYFVKGNELVVGPYQGPVACTRIKIPEGVCGTAVKEQKTIVVEDVNKFQGHIACSPDSKSEIVVPIFNKTPLPFGEGQGGGDVVVGVLDIDSVKSSNFDDIDKLYLEKLSKIIRGFIPAKSGIPR